MWVFCSVDELERRSYLKPGIWISLGLHLLLFVFLFFYGKQKLHPQDSFVELAEFNLVQPFKEVDATLAAKSGANKKTVPHSTKSEPVKSNDKSMADKPVSKPPIAQQKAPSENTQAANHEASSKSLAAADEGGALSENNGWLDAKEKSALATLSAQPATTEAKKVVIAAHSNEESDADNLTGWGRYGRQISIEAARLKRYPAVAISSHMQGTVLVSVSVSQSGDVVVGLKRSSGYYLLDEQAVAMVSQATKNIAIPTELKNAAKELFVPIRFSL